jgi:hypothetical protein
LKVFKIVKKSLLLLAGFFMNYAGKLIVSVARTSDNLKRPCKARLFFLIIFC